MSTILREYLRGMQLLAAFIVGRLPAHAVRLAFYRHILRIQIGRNTSVHWRAVFRGPEGVQIGSNTIVGNDVFLDGRRCIRIGSNVNVGGHVFIHTMEVDPQDQLFAATGGPVEICDYAYIASHVVILPGVRIGRGAVVAAGAVVVADVQDYEIVGGVPARRIGVRSSDLNYVLKYHHPFQ